MRSRAGLTAFLIVLSVLALPGPVTAGGGGGCYGQFRDQRSTHIVAERDCFSPTVARIQPGDRVAFKNADGVLHMVGGIAGSFGDLHTEIRPGSFVSYRFDEEGIFPYTCVLHPGMGGVIVVGDGGEAGAGSVTEVPSDDAEAAAAPASSTRSGSGRPWLIPVALVLAVGVLAIATIPRRRRSTSPAL